MQKVFIILSMLVTKIYGSYYDGSNNPQLANSTTLLCEGKLMCGGLTKLLRVTEKETPVLYLLQQKLPAAAIKEIYNTIKDWKGDNLFHECSKANATIVSPTLLDFNKILKNLKDDLLTILDEMSEEFSFDTLLDAEDARLENITG